MKLNGIKKTSKLYIVVILLILCSFSLCSCNDLTGEIHAQEVHHMTGWNYEVLAMLKDEYGFTMPESAVFTGGYIDDRYNDSFIFVAFDIPVPAETVELLNDKSSYYSVVTSWLKDCISYTELHSDEWTGGRAAELSSTFGQDYFDGFRVSAKRAATVYYSPLRYNGSGDAVIGFCLVGWRPEISRASLK